MKKFVQLFIKKYGINNYIAVKNQYNACVNCNRFYIMISQRLKYKSSTELAAFLNAELSIHFKEYAQYQ